MRYEEFRDSIRNGLRAHPQGLTWRELKDQLELPQKTPCYSWIARLETEIGLERSRAGRSMVWRLA